MENIDNGNKNLGHSRLYGGNFVIFLMKGSNFALDGLSKSVSRIVDKYWEGRYGRMFFPEPT